MKDYILTFESFLAKNNKVEYINTDYLWEINKNTYWEFDGNILTLDDVYQENLSDVEQSEMLDYHLASVDYWCGVFSKYIKINIPENYAINIYENGSVVDGNHRLVAAKILNIEKIPVIKKVE